MLLADEPTGNLDSATGGEIASLLDELHAQGSTIVLVTPNESLARRAERLVTLRDGRVERGGAAFMTRSLRRDRPGRSAGRGGS